MKNLFVAAAISVMGFASVVNASGPGDVKHHEGKPANTLTEAVANFSEYNAKLEAILGGAVTDNDMHDIHILTYTLENALGKINDELAELAQVLEELHLATERMDREAVLEHGRNYLTTSREVIK